MLLRNDLLHYEEGEGRTVRVLWFSPDSAGAAIIDVCEEKALPIIVRLDGLIEDVREKRARLLNPDPYLVLAIEASIPPSHKTIRDDAWSIIKNLVDKEPEIYKRDERGKILKAAIAEHKITLNTAYRYLRRYWQRGQTPNALLPDYANSGGRGKERHSTGKKRGRPRLYGGQKGINVTPDIRRAGLSHLNAIEPSKMAFTVMRLRSPCSQPLILCSFLVFWGYHEDEGRSAAHTDVRFDFRPAQRPAGQARSVRVAHGRGVRGTVQRRRVLRHRGVGQGTYRLAARLSGA